MRKKSEHIKFTLRLTDNKRFYRTLVNKHASFLGIKDK